MVCKDCMGALMEMGTRDAKFQTQIWQFHYFTHLSNVVWDDLAHLH
jgi:hypothetical protein